MAPDVGQSDKSFAKQLLDAKYGEGNYRDGPGSEFSKIKKWADSHFARSVTGDYGTHITNAACRSTKMF